MDRYDYVYAYYNNSKLHTNDSTTGRSKSELEQHNFGMT